MSDKVYVIQRDRRELYRTLFLVGRRKQRSTLFESSGRGRETRGRKGLGPEEKIVRTERT